MHLAQYRRMVVEAEDAGIRLADAGLDLEPGTGARVLREVVERA